MSTVVDCEVKGVNVRARRTCLSVVVSVGASFSIRVSVPYVLFTCRDFKRCIVVAVGVCARTGVSLFVP